MAPSDSTSASAWRAVARHGFARSSCLGRCHLPNLGDDGVGCVENRRCRVAAVTEILFSRRDDSHAREGEHPHGHPAGPRYSRVVRRHELIELVACRGQQGIAGCANLRMRASSNNTEGGAGVQTRGAVSENDKTVPLLGRHRGVHDEAPYLGREARFEPKFGRFHPERHRPQLRALGFWRLRPRPLAKHAANHSESSGPCTRPRREGAVYRNAVPQRWVDSTLLPDPENKEQSWRGERPTRRRRR